MEMMNNVVFLMEYSDEDDDELQGIVTMCSSAEECKHQAFHQTIGWIFIELQ